MIYQNVIEFIAAELVKLPGFSDPSRIVFIGETTPRYAVAFVCPHNNFFPEFKMDLDGYGGRTPSAKELDRQFETGKVKRAPLRQPPRSMLLGRNLLRLPGGDTIPVYAGQCQDCGRLIFSVGKDA